MDFSLTGEQIAIRDTVREFVERELKPLEQGLLLSSANGEGDHLPHEQVRALQRKARDSGLWGVDTPEEFGGVDLPWVTQSLITTELSRTFITFEFGGSADPVLYGHGEYITERFLKPTIAGDKIFCFALSEPGVGSDPQNLRTTAVRDGDDWVINGEKTWITLGHEADFVLVFCRTTHGDSEGVSAFLVDRDAGWKSSPIRMMGRDDPATLSFEDVRVPDAHRIGEVGRAFDVALDFIYRNRVLFLPGLQIGGCERLLQMAVDYAQVRTTFGEPLSQRENIRFMIAESEIELRALKLLALNGAWLHDMGRDYRHAACTTNYFGANVANRIVDRVMQIHGGIGYSKELPIERWYRDFRVERIYEGSDEMNLLSISRNLFKGYVTIGDIY